VKSSSGCLPGHTVTASWLTQSLNHLHLFAGKRDAAKQPDPGQRYWGITGGCSYPARGQRSRRSLLLPHARPPGESAFLLPGAHLHDSGGGAVIGLAGGMERGVLRENGSSDCAGWCTVRCAQCILFLNMDGVAWRSATDFGQKLGTWNSCDSTRSRQGGDCTIECGHCAALGNGTLCIVKGV